MGDDIANADTEEAPTADGGDELIGQVLDDRFRIDELIGEGGMGRVYRGHQLSVERDVAIKVLHGELTLEEELRDRFFREGKVVSGFTHPNIVKLIDFGRSAENGLLYLVMEMIEGIGLDELLEQGRLKPQLALRIAHQTCGALIEAHGKGVIHRDLKAENLLLVAVSDGTLQAKVVDFGIAYPQEASKKLTMTGRIYGTASYMAPEQAQGKEVDERADLFSLGVLMFEMLAGQLPIEGTNSIEVMIKQIQEGPPALSAVLPPDSLPREVFELVDGLLANSPDIRPKSARVVREHLETIFRDQGWQPVRLDTKLDFEEMFEPWILPPIEISEADAVNRSADDPGSGSQPSPDPQATPDTVAGGGTNKQWSSSDDSSTQPATPTAGESAPEGVEMAPPPDTEVDSGGSNAMLLLAVLILLFVLVVVPIAGYFAVKFLRPDLESPMDLIRNTAETKEATPASTGEDDQSSTADEEKKQEEPDEGAEEGDDQGAAGDQESDKESNSGSIGPETDPVCGRVDRVDLPASWPGKYRPQGDSEGESGTLTVSSKKLHARWEGGGATLFVGKSDKSGDQVSVECGRYAGTGSGERCSGTFKRSGPVLIVEMEGTEGCENQISGAWLKK